MAGNEVDALLGLAFLVCVDFRAAHNSVRDPPYRMRLAPEERADIVAESAVPLLPAVADEAADLVEAGCVPSLGDKLRPGQRRVALNIPQDRRVRYRIARRVARQNRSEIEAESVHVHFRDPV